MMTFAELVPAASELPEPVADRLQLTVAAYLARFKGSSREHTESDLRCYLSWCAERGLDPLAAQRPHLELYIRWRQGIRRFKPTCARTLMPRTEQSPYVTPTATLPSEAWAVASIQAFCNRQGRDSRPRRGSLYGLAGSSLLAWLTWLIT
jgi:hypothetical protein